MEMPEALGKLRTLVLAVDDLNAACAFYTDVLGFPLRFRDGDRWAQLDAGGIDIALAAGGERPATGIALSLKVGDVAAALDRVRSGGGEVAGEPARGAHEIRASFTDRDGHLIYLYSSVEPPR